MSPSRNNRRSSSCEDINTSESLERHVPIQNQKECSQDTLDVQTIDEYTSSACSILYDFGEMESAEAFQMTREYWAGAVDRSNAGCAEQKNTSLNENGSRKSRTMERRSHLTDNYNRSRRTQVCSSRNSSNRKESCQCSPERRNRGNNFHRNRSNSSIYLTCVESDQIYPTPTSSQRSKNNCPTRYAHHCSGNNDCAGCSNTGRKKPFNRNNECEVSQTSLEWQKVCNDIQKRTQEHNLTCILKPTRKQYRRQSKDSLSGRKESKCNLKQKKHDIHITSSSKLARKQCNEKRSKRKGTPPSCSNKKPTNEMGLYSKKTSAQCYNSVKSRLNEFKKDSCECLNTCEEVKQRSRGHHRACECSCECLSTCEEAKPRSRGHHRTCEQKNTERKSRYNSKDRLNEKKCVIFISSCTELDKNGPERYYNDRHDRCKCEKGNKLKHRNSSSSCESMYEVEKKPSKNLRFSNKSKNSLQKNSTNFETEQCCCCTSSAKNKGFSNGRKNNEDMGSCKRIKNQIGAQKYFERTHNSRKSNISQSSNEERTVKVSKNDYMISSSKDQYSSEKNRHSNENGRIEKPKDYSLVDSQKSLERKTRSSSEDFLGENDHNNNRGSCLYLFKDSHMFWFNRKESEREADNYVVMSSKKNQHTIRKNESDQRIEEKEKLQKTSEAKPNYIASSPTYNKEKKSYDKDNSKRTKRDILMVGSSVMDKTNCDEYCSNCSQDKHDHSAMSQREHKAYQESDDHFKYTRRIEENMPKSFKDDVIAENTAKNFEEENLFKETKKNRDIELTDCADKFERCSGNADPVDTDLLSIRDVAPNACHSQPSAKDDINLGGSNSKKLRNDFSECIPDDNLNEKLTENHSKCKAQNNEENRKDSGKFSIELDAPKNPDSNRTKSSKSNYQIQFADVDSNVPKADCSRKNSNLNNADPKISCCEDTADKSTNNQPQTGYSSFECKKAEQSFSRTNENSKTNKSDVPTKSSLKTKNQSKHCQIESGPNDSKDVGQQNNFVETVATKNQGENKQNFSAKEVRKETANKTELNVQLDGLLVDKQYLPLQLKTDIALVSFSKSIKQENLPNDNEFPAKKKRQKNDSPNDKERLDISASQMEQKKRKSRGLKCNLFKRFSKKKRRDNSEFRETSDSSRSYLNESTNDSSTSATSSFASNDKSGKKSSQKREHKNRKNRKRRDESKDNKNPGRRPRCCLRRKSVKRNSDFSDAYRTSDTDSCYSDMKISLSNHSLYLEHTGKTKEKGAKCRSTDSYSPKRRIRTEKVQKKGAKEKDKNCENYNGNQCFNNSLPMHNSRCSASERRSRRSNSSLAGNTAGFSKTKSRKNSNCEDPNSFKVRFCNSPPVADKSCSSIRCEEQCPKPCHSTAQNTMSRRDGLNSCGCEGPGLSQCPTPWPCTSLSPFPPASYQPALPTLCCRHNNRTPLTSTETLVPQCVSDCALQTQASTGRQAPYSDCSCWESNSGSYKENKRNLKQALDCLKKDKLLRKKEEQKRLKELKKLSKQTKRISKQNRKRSEAVSCNCCGFQSPTESFQCGSISTNCLSMSNCRSSAGQNSLNSIRCCVQDAMQNNCQQPSVQFILKPRRIKKKSKRMQKQKSFNCPCSCLYSSPCQYQCQYPPNDCFNLPPTPFYDQCNCTGVQPMKGYPPFMFCSLPCCFPNCGCNCGPPMPSITPPPDNFCCNTNCCWPDDMPSEYMDCNNESLLTYYVAQYRHKTAECFNNRKCPRTMEDFCDYGKKNSSRKSQCSISRKRKAMSKGKERQASKKNCRVCFCDQ